VGTAALVRQVQKHPRTHRMRVAAETLLRAALTPISLRATQMIALHPHSLPLGPVEQFGLDVLLDLSRLLRFTGDGDVVRLHVSRG
jgi:hypothetical protein